MNDEHMLMYALVFVLGFMVARMMSGRLVEGEGVETNTKSYCKELEDSCIQGAQDKWLEWVGVPPLNKSEKGHPVQYPQRVGARDKTIKDCKADYMDCI